jgi:hypothetical protein
VSKPYLHPEDKGTRNGNFFYLLMSKKGLDQTPKNNISEISINKNSEKTDGNPSKMPCREKSTPLSNMKGFVELKANFMK